MALLLNYFPISFSTKSFDGQTIPISDTDKVKEQLDELRETHGDTHFFYCHDPSIYCVPYENSTLSIGPQKTFNIDTDFQFANAVARNALIRLFVSENRVISGLRPVRIVLTEKNLLSDQSEVFGAYPEYSFDVRPIVPQESKMISGIIIDFKTRRLFEKQPLDLISSGLSLEGLYLQIDTEPSDRLVDDQFRRTLIGRIVSIKGDIATLDDSPLQEIPLADTFLEPSSHNFEVISRQLYGSNQNQFKDAFMDATFEISGAVNQLERINKLGQWLNQKCPLSCSSGLELNVGANLFECEGGTEAGNQRTFKLPACVLRPGGSITVQWPVDRHIDRNGPYDSETFPDKRVRIAVICPKDLHGECESFLAQLKNGLASGRDADRFKQGLVRKYRLTSCDYTFFEPNDGSAASYKNAALSSVDSEPHLAIVVIKEKHRELRDGSNPYYVTKATLMSQGVPVQALKIETIRTQNNPYTLNNLALSIYAKIGGIPWVLSSTPALVHEVIVGIGSARISEQRLGDSDRVVGITTVFSGDGNYLLASTTKEVDLDSYGHELVSNLRDTVASLSKRYGWAEGDRVRLIFHQSFKKYKDVEAEAVERFIEALTEYEVEYAFVHLSNDHNWRLLDPESKGYRNKGVNVPSRGLYVPLGPHAGLLTLTGPGQLKLPKQGCPRPLLISVHHKSSFQSLDYISAQVFKLTFMSWRTFFPITSPVSLDYSNRLVDLLGHLRPIPNWNPDSLRTKLKEKRWFL